MKTWVRKTLSVGVLAAAALLFGPGVAHADVHQDSYHNNGILNGAQIYAPVDVPINICGNGLALLGAADTRAICANGAARNLSAHRGGFGQHSHHNNGIGNGLQFAAPVHLPVNVCGNAFGFLGGAHAAAFCSNGHGGVDRDRGHRHGHGGVNGDRGHRHGHGGVNGDRGHRHGHGQDCDAVDTAVHGRNLGDGASLGDKDDTKYGSHSRSVGGSSAAEPVEASPVSSLTQGVGATDLGELDLPKTLG